MDKVDVTIAANLDNFKTAINEGIAELQSFATASKETGDTSAAAAAQQEVVTQTMELASMTARQLKNEILALTAARKEAAKAGDQEAYNQLTEQLKQARAAHRQATQAANLQKAAWSGQIQAAAQLGSTVSGLTSQLQNFSKNAKDGTLNISGMASSFAQLGMAVKSGLGPLALAIYSLEQIQSVYKQWSSYFGDSKESKSSWAKKMQQDAEDLKKAREALSTAEAAYRNAQLKDYDKRNKDFVKGLQEQQKEAADKRQREYAADEAASQHRIALLRSELKTAEEGDRQRIENEIRQEEEASDRRKAERAKAAADSAREYADKLDEELSKDKYQNLLQIKLPSLERLNELNAKIDAADWELRDISEEEVKNMEKERRALELEMKAVLNAVREVDSGFEGTRVQAVEFVKTLQETNSEQRKIAEAARKRAENLQQTADAAETEKKYKDEEREAEAQSAAAQKRIAEAKKEQERQERQIREYQQQLGERLRDILSSTKTTGNYTVEDNRTKREILNDDAAILRQREQELTRLLNDRHLTDDQRKQINAALDEVHKQTRGLAQAQAANATAARKWLRELEPPKLTASKKQAQHRLDALAKVYARQVKAAERAASSGDDKAYRRLSLSVARTADAMANVSGKADKVYRLYDETDDKLEAVKRSSSRVATANNKLATQTERAANTGNRQNPAQQTLATAQKVQRATADMNAKTAQMNTALGDIGTSVQTLSDTIGNAGKGFSDLSSIITQLNDTASKGFGKIGDILNAHSNQLKALQDQINMLKGVH